MADIELGEDGQVITSAGNNFMSVATVVNRVAASVVEITTETVAQSDRLGQYITSGAGSGVIISREGFIVTNHHVIEGASTVTVRLNNGKEFAATVVGTDEATDVAVLWIDAAGYELTVATLGSSFDLVVGEDILAIGNPMGSLGGTVTEGMISATARQIKVGNSVMTLLQVSAPINPGNSGGGLFNMAGELVGIVNAKIADESIEGLGFAIPVDTAYDIVLEIIEYGYVRGRPDLGFNIVDVTSVQTAMRYFNSFYTGVYVYDEKHGTVKYGDRILTVDGVNISSSAEVIAIAAGKRVGDTLTLEVVRKGDVKTLTVTIAEKRPAAKNADE
jgi:serine protease Do